MPSIGPILEKSEERRRKLQLSDTDAYRLVDGEGDLLPGIHLDLFAGRRLISTLDARLPPDLRDWCTKSGATTYWKCLDQHDRESPRHVCGALQREPFRIREHGVRYLINFQAGYSQGIFLDQRDNRQRVRKSSRSGDSILNTFAYTGAFSVCAALGGATTTTLDLSQPYLDWARDNMRLNEIDPAAHHFCKGDTFHWLRRFARQGRTFNGIILDPPTFSRDDKGKVFRAEDDYGHLVELAAACLAPNGWLLCTTNCRRLSAPDFEHTVRASLPQTAELTAYAMPPDFSGEPYLKSLFVTT